MYLVHHHVLLFLPLHLFLHPTTLVQATFIFCLDVCNSVQTGVFSPLLFCVSLIFQLVPFIYLLLRSQYRVFRLPLGLRQKFHNRALQDPHLLLQPFFALYVLLIFSIQIILRRIFPYGSFHHSYQHSNSRSWLARNSRFGFGVPSFTWQFFIYLESYHHVPSVSYPLLSKMVLLSSLEIFQLFWAHGMLIKDFMESVFQYRPCLL